MRKEIIEVGEKYRLDGTEMEVEVIEHSCGADWVPDIFTIRMRYPRIIHAEVMTHRVFGRNARSSRAVPIKTMLCEIMDAPFVPWHWGLNQSGMQADEENTADVFLNDAYKYRRGSHISRETAWKFASSHAYHIATAFMNAGYHKQVVNRLLEPFMWIDVLITSTDWNNFLWLRDHKDAEPHLQDLARLVEAAMTNSTPNLLEPGEWHLPYISQEDTAFLMSEDNVHDVGNLEFLQRVSAARCARISYRPFDGDASYTKELARYDMLVSSDRVHASPLEHQATPDHLILIDGVMVDEEGETIEELGTAEKWNSPDLHGNLDGWIQFRKLVPNEWKP